MSECGKFDALAARAWDIFRTMEASQCGFVVQPSIPILFFGDSGNYFASPLKVITVGLNPSKKEFDGLEPFHRFPRARHPAGAADSLEDYICALNEYFKTDPYCDWFSCYEPILQGIGVSYYPGTAGAALHTDICSPVATDPTWTQLPHPLKNSVWQDGQQLWHDLVRVLKPDAIVVSVARQYVNGIEFTRTKAARPLFTINRANPYVVTVEDIKVTDGRKSLLVVGRAAQKPFGKVSNPDKGRIGLALQELIMATSD